MWIGERPYRCHVPECGRAFIQLSNLQQHLRNHDAQLERAKNRPFQCAICGKGFATESSLRTHTAKVKSSKTQHVSLFLIFFFFVISYIILSIMIIITVSSLQPKYHPQFQPESHSHFQPKLQPNVCYHNCHFGLSLLSEPENTVNRWDGSICIAIDVSIHAELIFFYLFIFFCCYLFCFCYWRWLL